METQVNPEDAEDKKSNGKKNDPSQTEEPGKNRQCGDEMNGKKAVDVVLLPSCEAGVDDEQSA